MAPGNNKSGVLVTSQNSQDTNELHRVCSRSFSCGYQSGFLYPFWISGRADCGHPDFKLDCSRGFAELSISSVKFRILEVSYESRFIRLARSDYIGDLCPNDPLSMPFDENVLPLVPNTTMLTILLRLRRRLFTLCFYLYLSCGDDGRSYYVTRNLSSSLLDGIRGHLYDFDASCKINNQTRYDLQKALAKDSKGACGYNESAATYRKRKSNLKHLENALHEGFDVKVKINEQTCEECVSSHEICGFKNTTQI
ncbi:LOW QUALITY PROTEIN: hypothetical protein N665_0060s0005 [Sinapis alba]|nr:LOW QUALITY PROTEIN: hypothetical protein N665_0060s0005 [Sinapis alba]